MYRYMLFIPSIFLPFLSFHSYFLHPFLKFPFWYFGMIWNIWLPCLYNDLPLSLQVKRCLLLFFLLSIDSETLCSQLLVLGKLLFSKLRWPVIVMIFNSIFPFPFRNSIFPKVAYVTQKAVLVHWSQPSKSVSNLIKARVWRNREIP